MRFLMRAPIVVGGVALLMMANGFYSYYLLTRTGGPAFTAIENGVAGAPFFAEPPLRSEGREWLRIAGRTSQTLTAAGVRIS